MSSKQPTTKKGRKNAVKKSPSARKVPKYINNGTYGCVFRPGVSCEKKPNDLNTISKVFSSQVSTEEEYELHQDLISKIDPEGIFTLKLLGTCDIVADKLPMKEINKCGNFDYYARQKTVFPQIQYEYGGFDLSQASRRYSFETLFRAMWRVFKGLVILDKKGYVHADIKPENMVYNDQTNKLALIDFGLTTEKSIIFTDEMSYLHKHVYRYYPSEFPVFYSRKFYMTTQPNGFNIFQNVRDKQAAMKDFSTLMAKYPSAQIKPVDDLIQKIVFTYDLSYFIDPDSKIDFPNKIDVHMLGVSLLEVFYLCEVHSRNSILDNIPFYVAALKLLKKMTRITPVNRLSPVQAYKEYQKVVKLLSASVDKNKRISPLRVKRNDDKPIKEKSVKLSSDSIITKVPKNKEKGVKECPPGKTLNPITNRCIKIKEPTKPKDCPPGQERNPLTKRCRKIPEPPRPKVCPPGKVINPKTNRCIKAK